MTYEEIMAQANNSGMSAEEFARRDQLIRNVSQHNPELAAQIARGPYRMNGGSQAPSVAAAASSQAPGSYPNQMYDNRPAPGSAQGVLGTPTMGSASPPQTGGVTPTGVRTVQGPPTQAGVYPVASQPVSAYPPRQTEVGNPRYDFPENATGSRQQTPTVNINIGNPAAAAASYQGAVPQMIDAAQAPTNQYRSWIQDQYNSATGPSQIPALVQAMEDPTEQYRRFVMQHSGLNDASQLIGPMFSGAPPIPPSPLGNPSAMHNPDYPMSPNFGGPMQPSGYATSMWDNSYMNANPALPPTFGNLGR